jgi:hypothetical protein
MMRRILAAVIFAVVMLGTVAIGYADQLSGREARHRIREARQSIERGIDRGLITRSEARKLFSELDMIRNKFRNMKDDGYLSPMERETLDRDLDRIERHIRREKHDDDRRGRDFGRDRDYDRGRRY